MPDLIEWLTEHEPAFRKSRLPSLYSDLSVQKTTNPEGYAANVLAWQSALARAALAGRLPTEQRLVIQASEELLDALASQQYGRPSGLGLALDDGVRNGKMLELKDFENAEQSIYHHNWIPSPWTVLRWGLKQTGLVRNASFDKSGRLRSGQLVSVHALEEIYKQIQATQKELGTNLTDRVMTREAFSNGLARLNGEILTTRDTDILLRYLERDKEVLSYDSKTVKFKPPTASTPEPITTEDTTIANLRSLIINLESQVTNLNARITALQRNARSAVEAKNKTAALTALRSKKLAEGALQQRSETLSQLEQVYAKIEQAVDQVQIMEVMQSSVSVLKGLNQIVGGVDRVEDVVEELREEMSKVDEVGQVLQEPLGGSATLDEAEVDEEFEALEQEERRKEEERQAEATQQRLAELERAEKRQQLEKEKAQKEAEADEVESSMRNSIEGLDKMKISGNDEEAAASSETRSPQQREHEQDRVPEAALS